MQHASRWSWGAWGRRSALAPRWAEKLPKPLLFVPIVVHWFLVAIRFRSVTLPSSCNPTITAGGLVGDRKSEYFEAMGPYARRYVAPWGILCVDATTARASVARLMATHGLAFPVILKPDLGWCGFGVRRIDSQAELDRYLDAFPRGAWLMVQRYLPEEGEAGIFYLRRPGESRGTLLGILLRHAATVTGDGQRSLQSLVDADERLARTTRCPSHECVYDAQRVPLAGERVRLSAVGSTRVGGRYEDGSAWATSALLDVVDAIARDMPSFHVGRFDVRFADRSALQRGEFTIMEVNGAGSEAVHAWDPRYTLWQTYGLVFAKQRLLFELGAQLRRHGHEPIGARRLAAHFLKQRALIKRYPRSN